MIKDDDLKSTIVNSVQQMYDKFPYPNYPLWVRPRWQDAYLASSMFASALYEHHTSQTAAIRQCKPAQNKFGKKILIIGSGDMLPLVLRKYEPKDYKLICVDLSKRSLRRARMRLLLNTKPVMLVQSDIDEFLEKQGGVGGPFDHVEIYGALHHFYDPISTLRLLHRCLSPHGTMRLMVYNSQARKWIHQLQNIFRLMKLNCYSKKDKDTAREFLELISVVSAPLKNRLGALGAKTISIDARFVDTFFHPHELRIDIAGWFKMFDEAGFKLMGLFDRYGELDDLANPLWSTPTKDQLQVRAEDGRFENNLELYFSSTDVTGENTKHDVKDAITFNSAYKYFIKSFPYLWKTFPETKNIKFITLQKLWWKYTCYSLGLDFNNIDSLVYSVPMTALQRLGRLGGIFPEQITDQYLRKSLLQPMASDMESYYWGAPEAALPLYVQNRISDILESKGTYSDKKLELILQRLIKAQL